jgi:hypothetical protein
VTDAARIYYRSAEEVCKVVRRPLNGWGVRVAAAR